MSSHDRATAGSPARAAGPRPPAPDGRAVSPEMLRETRHSLRTPLNHIIGYSEMLLESADDPGLEALVPDLRRVHAAGQHLLSQVDRLLGPAQIAAGAPSTRRSSAWSSARPSTPCLATPRSCWRRRPS